MHYIKHTDTGNDHTATQPIRIMITLAVRAAWGAAVGRRAARAARGVAGGGADDIIFYCTILYYIIVYYIILHYLLLYHMI